MIDFRGRDSMSAKERMAALAAGQPIDRVPFMPFALCFAARIGGMDRGEVFRHPEKAFAVGMNLLEVYPWMNGKPAYGWGDRGAWEFGGNIVWPDGDSYAGPWSDPIIASPEEVDALPSPDPETAGMVPLQDAFNRICREHGFTASLPGGTPTTISSSIVGRENFLRWMVKYPEVVHKLQRKSTDFVLRCAERTIAKYGAQNCGVYAGVPMESNQLISASMFETFAKPYIREIFDCYTSAGVKNITVHLCGDHRANLPHWKDIPLPRRTIFSIGDEMDLERTGEAIGIDNILAGNVNCSMLCAGSPEEVFAEVKRCLEAGRKHAGGFVLMPACELPPDTPLENMEALAAALFQYGYYRSSPDENKC